MQRELQWLYQSNNLPKIEGKPARLKEDYCFLIEFGVQKLTLNSRWGCTSNCTLFYYEDWRAERYTEMQAGGQSWLHMQLIITLTAMVCQKQYNFTKICGCCLSMDHFHFGKYFKYFYSQIYSLPKGAGMFGE